MEHALIGFVDLSVEEVIALASLVGPELPAYLLGPGDPPTQAQLDAAAIVGRRALVARGVLVLADGELKADAPVLEAVELACRPDLTLLALSVGATSLGAWILSDQRHATVVVAVGQGVFRHRVVEIDRVGAVLRKLLPVADPGPSAAAPLLDSSTVDSLRARAAAGETLEGIDLPEDVTVNALISGGAGPTDPLADRSVWWLSGEGVLQRVVSAGGSASLEPCTRQQIWDAWAHALTVELAT